MPSTATRARTLLFLNRGHKCMHRHLNTRSFKKYIDVVGATGEGALSSRILSFAFPCTDVFNGGPIKSLFLAAEEAQSGTIKLAVRVHRQAFKSANKKNLNSEAASCLTMVPFIRECYRKIS